LCCPGAATGLATDRSLIQGALPYVVKLTEARAHWGCGAADDDDDEY
jgi:hypothetical protein